MKFLPILFIMCLIGTNAMAQDFEGYILYKYTYQDKQGNDITEKLGEELGLEQHYYIDAENYKGINEKGLLMQLYNAKTNQYYFQDGSEVKMLSAELEFPKEFSAEESEETLIILGYNCKSIITTSESGQLIYFFNNEISVGKENFNKHRLGNWGNYLNVSNGGVPLKIVREDKDYTQIMEAVKVEKKELHEDEFSIEKVVEKKQ